MVESRTEPGQPTPTSSTEQSSLRPAGQPKARPTWLGLPRFDWSLTFLGLCIFTFAVVTYRLPVAELGIVLALVGLVLQRGGIRLPPPVWIYGAFVLWAFIASFGSQHLVIANAQVVERLKLWIIMIIAVNALRTEGRLRFYLLFLIGCYILFPVRGALMDFFIYGNRIFGRAIWNYIYINPNDLATLSLLALGVALAVAFSTASHAVVRLGSGIGAILMLVVILLTQSRAAFIGLVVALGPALALRVVKRPMLLVATIVAGLAISPWIPDSVWERLAGIEKLTSAATIAEADWEGSAEQRYEVQKVALRIFIDNPVFGVGLGTYPLENARYAPQLGKRDTHNTYLNLAAEVGLPGLLLWCALVWSVLRYARRSRRNASNTALASEQIWIERAFWGFLVASLFGTYAGLTFPYLMLALLWCSASLLNPSQTRREPVAHARAQ